MVASWGCVTFLIRWGSVFGSDWALLPRKEKETFHSNVYHAMQLWNTLFSSTTGNKALNVAYKQSFENIPIHMLSLCFMTNSNVKFIRNSASIFIYQGVNHLFRILPDNESIIQSTSRVWKVCSIFFFFQMYQ